MPSYLPAKHLLVAALVALAIFTLARSGKETRRARIASQEASSTVARRFISELPQIWTTPKAFESATGTGLGKFKQSPILDQAVAAGRLPAIELRLPEEEKTMQPVGTLGPTNVVEVPRAGVSSVPQSKAEKI